MKLVVKNSLVTCTLFFLTLPLLSRSQDLTGIWKGYFVTDNGQSYRLEFQIEQNKNATVTGVSYSYGNSIEFYGKATMTGKYALTDKMLLIQEIKTVEVKSAGGGTCIMNYRFTFSKSGNEEYLEGTYVGKKEDRNNPNNNGIWGDCGGGRCFLRRVESSDFYVEPFLRKNDPKKDSPVTGRTPVPERKPEIKPTPSPPVKTPATTKKAPVPTQKKPVTTQKKPVTQKPVITQKNTPASQKPVADKKDTVQKKPSPAVVNVIPEEHARVKIPETTRSRTNELTQTFTVSSEEIQVRLYDNGEVDGDTISVYLDGKPLLTNKRLSTVPITLSIKMDPSNPEHTLVMVAENMGRIPPNTSLMIVQDGDKRYQASITSTEQKNAMVRFRYERKSD
jgi:hypothetical protein